MRTLSHSYIDLIQPALEFGVLMFTNNMKSLQLLSNDFGHRNSCRILRSCRIPQAPCDYLLHSVVMFAWGAQNLPFSHVM